MRTTIDLPDELLRQVKARAAVQGMKLKEYVTEALRESLYRHEPASRIGETATEYGEDSLVVAEGCVFPLIGGRTGDAMRTLTEEAIAEILEEEEVDAALSAG
ncbi:MAG: hypothetical protein DWQ36_07045 [Acidobacteria bacterium]|nr:MAG: hypothetical protein DWQ30_24480 [Acidobacteriota bacterium]REK09298.1 MAG: hypothetical protein DWQ36_07045 [Acidobacteriota bacterium]